jgi:elongation factor 1-alpha
MELAYVVVGSVDSGKSTLIGTIKSNKLDDGNGSNRMFVSNHKHEITSGKTSSIAIHSLKEYQKNKSLILIDLCGHEKYLKTTMFGIMSYYPDYAIVIIGANRGILKMTREHIKILHHLKIPMILVVTKTDIIDNVYSGSEENGLDKITSDIKKIFSKGNYNVIEMPTSNTLSGDELYKVVPTTKEIPLFKLSCKTGVGLDIFKRYISDLPRNQHILSKLDTTNTIIKNKNNNSNNIFYIETIYCPPGIGWVVTGILKCSNDDGCISTGSQLHMGPFTENVQVKVWSIYNYYDEKIDKLYNGQRGCLAIRCDKKLSRTFFKKGTIITNNLDIIKMASYKYKASIRLLSHPTNVRDNFCPVIHCNTVRQTASIRILNITHNPDNKQNTENTNINTNLNNSWNKNELNNFGESKKCIFPGENAIIELEFKYKPEFIQPNELFFLREGLTLGVGTILNAIY